MPWHVAASPPVVASATRPPAWSTRPWTPRESASSRLRTVHMAWALILDLPSCRSLLPLPVSFVNDPPTPLPWSFKHRYPKHATTRVSADRAGSRLDPAGDQRGNQTPVGSRNQQRLPFIQGRRGLPHVNPWEREPRVLTAWRQGARGQQTFGCSSNFGCPYHECKTYQYRDRGVSHHLLLVPVQRGETVRPEPTTVGIKEVNSAHGE